MKAFEVKLAVTGGHKDQTRTVFVEANTKSEATIYIMGEGWAKK